LLLLCLAIVVSLQESIRLGIHETAPFEVKTSVERQAVYCAALQVKISLKWAQKAASNLSFFV
jgi:hypothetical protein